MFLANILSCAHLPKIHVCKFSRELEAGDLLVMPAEQLDQFKKFSSSDPVLQVLGGQIARQKCLR